MKLEPIIQVKQVRKRNINCILTHTYGIQKDGTDEFICKAAMEKQTQRTDLWTQWEGRRERMRCMERVTWKLALPYAKEIANGNLLKD